MFRLISHWYYTQQRNSLHLESTTFDTKRFCNVSNLIAFVFLENMYYLPTGSLFILNSFALIPSSLTFGSARKTTAETAAVQTFYYNLLFQKIRLYVCMQYVRYFRGVGK